MARKLRVEYPGALYHVMSRGDLATAARLRQETTMTLKWISQRLEMGAWTHLNRRLYEQRQSEGRSSCRS